MAEQSVPATPENVERALQLIERQQGGGGTELLPALKRVLTLPARDTYARTVVIATDGYVQVEEEVFDLIRTNLSNANMFTFGIGTSVNRHIIEGMARVGMGEPFVITKAEEAQAQAERFRRLIQSPLLTRVKVRFNGFDVYDVEPSAVPDLMADRPLIMFGKWRGRPGGTITVSGITGKGPYIATIKPADVRPARENSALRYLWARQRIALLSDYNMLRQNDDRVAEVTRLGLTYNLLTTYTSFVALHSKPRTTDRESVTVKQPLPLPQGVSDLAVGGLAMKQSMAPASQSFRMREAKECVSDKADASKAKGGVVVERVVVSGTIPKQAVTEAVQKKNEAIASCCHKSGLKGTFVLRLTVSAEGAVQNAMIVSGASTPSTAQACLLEELKKLQFPSTADGRTAEVTLTLRVT